MPSLAEAELLAAAIFATETRGTPPSPFAMRLPSWRDRVQAAYVALKMCESDTFREHVERAVKAAHGG